MRFDYKTLVAVALMLAGAGVFGVTLVRATLLPPVEQEAAPLIVNSGPASEADAPVRMRIPSLNIDAAVQHVGIGKTGNMAVPTNFTDVGWYRYGTTPGFLGSAVIDGHVDNGLALPGVFKHLSDIKVGDDIAVETSAGAVLHFTVEETDIYNYKEVPVQKIFTQNDKARLNLITCDGAWVAGEKTYDHRLVVYAVRSS